ncbi:hypothetical protein ALP75_202013 [Pseudomonas syringae pv. actinidiae]|nr:hypothetical protein ALP75_202013 [Pseudomonas syringae pv. actinidiae]
MARQLFEQAELIAGQFQRTPLPARLTLARPEGQLASMKHVPDRVGRRHRAHPAHDRPQTRNQLARRTGLGHVIIGAQLKPGNPVDVVAARRQENHRHLALRANTPEHFDAGHTRHHDVEHNNVVTTGQRFDFTLFGAVGTGHSEAFAGQVLAEHVRQFPIIIDKQYGCHGSTLMGDYRLSRRGCGLSARPVNLYPTLHCVNRPQHPLPLCCAANGTPACAVFLERV